MSGFHGAFATGVACQQGTLTLPDTWFRPPFWDLLMLQLLRPNSSNLPCLYSTFHLGTFSILHCTINLNETPSSSVRSLTNTIPSGSESIRSRDCSLPASASQSETGTVRSVSSIASSIKIPPGVLPKPNRKSVNAFHGSLRCKPLKSALKTSSLQHNIKLSDYIDEFGEDSPHIVSCNKKRISFRRSKKMEKDLANSALKDDSSDSVSYTSYANAAFVEDMENVASGKRNLEPIEEGPITLILYNQYLTIQLVCSVYVMSSLEVAGICVSLSVFNN